MLKVAYLAGLFDGEGCIHIPITRSKKQFKSYGLRVIYCLINEEVIRQIAAHAGVTYCKLKKSNPKWRDAYQVQICSERAADLLREMLPYLIVKKEEALLALKLQENITLYRNKLKSMDADSVQAVLDYREGLRLQISALKRVSGASDGMMANSENTRCPVSNDAEGQPRAKQTALKAVGRV